MKLLAAAGALTGLVLLAVVSVAMATAVGAVARTAYGPAAEVVPPLLVPIIDDAATSCPQITPALLAAQLHQESGFRATAVSAAGAEGIAQFLPGTWATWGVDADGDGVANPFDPVDAIWSDARMLCALVARAARSTVPGNPVALALAGYNAGWGAVVRFDGIPPYRQTQIYVAAILAAAARYAAVLAS